jgi:hypothetical protein
MKRESVRNDGAAAGGGPQLARRFEQQVGEPALPRDVDGSLDGLARIAHVA